MLVELSRRKALVKREVPVEVYFEGDPIGTFRFDMLVDDVVLVETKSTEGLSEADERQVLNYLRATRIEVGMLLHFGPKPRFRRFVYSNDNKQFKKLDPR